MTRKLSRLRDFGTQGLPGSALQWSQRVCEQIEAQFGSLQDQITAIAAAQAAADAAQTTANTAQTTASGAVTDAANAQTTADTAKKNDAISSSWTSPGVILSASDAGSNATITIANHTRKYGDSTSVSVTGASLTGLAHTTTYFVYYDDTAHAGGTVTFHTATNPNTALPNSTTGRHYCGEITTPASGGGSTSGGVSPPGSGGQLTGTDIP